MSETHGRKIFIRNLPFWATSDDLEKMAMPHGVVRSAHVATDRETGRSRGFAFVEFESADQAADAVTALDAVFLGGRQLSVVIATPRPRQ